MGLFSKTSRRANVFEISEMIIDTGVIEDAAEAAEGDAHAVGAARATVLAAAFDVRLEIEKDAGNAAAMELLLDRWQNAGEIAENPLVNGVADVGGHEMGKFVFVDVLGVGFRGCGFQILGFSFYSFARRMQGRGFVIFNVHPAQAGLHGFVLGEDFGGRKALNQEIRGVEDQFHAGMVDLAEYLGQKVTGAADQVRLDFQPESQVGAVARFGDLAQLLHGLRQMVLRIGPLGRIERKAANQLGLERVGKFACLLHIVFEVLLERNEGVFRAVFDILELHFAQRRADRRNVQSVLVFEMPNFLHLGDRKLHHILDARADVDEPDAVILQSQRREGGELLHGRFLVGGLVGETGKNDAGDIGIGHGKLPRL